MKNKRLILLVFILFGLSSYLSAKVFYIDPVKGSPSGDGSLQHPWKTLEQVVDDNLIESYSYVLPYDPNRPQLKPKNPNAPIQAGDTLMLYGGKHGTLYLRGYINTANITIMALPGEEPILKQIHLLGCKNWVLDGLTVSSEPYGDYIHNNLVFFESHKWHGPVSLIEIKNCTVYSTLNPWTKAVDWNTKASSGIYIKADSVLALNNTVKNVDFGISGVGDHLHIEGNTVTNFSGDGLRVLGTHGVYLNNIIMNCYDTNDNHDDGIQSFTTGGRRVDSNIISGNIILNYTDPQQPLLGPLQGIGCFDGPYNHWLVENNIVIVNHWHGISFYGAYNCSVINNTVLDPTPGIKPGPSWIKIESHKNGVRSDSNIVKNNIANTFSVNSKNKIEGNNIQLVNLDAYKRNFVDYQNFDFHLLKTSICIDKGDDNYAPAKDKDGIPRPQGIHSDVGAYEYRMTTASKNNNAPQNHWTLSPNPAVNQISIDGVPAILQVDIYDLSGQLTRRINRGTTPLKLDITSLKHGVYVVYLKELNTLQHHHFILVKK